MRVLVLCHHYPPEIGAAAKRMENFVRVWRSAGVDVDVVTSLPHYPSGSWDRSVSVTSLIGQATGSFGESIRRVPFVPGSRSGATKLLDQLVVAGISGMRSAPTRPDVVFASVPGLPTLAPAVAASTLHRAPLVLEFRDAWPDLVSESAIAPTEQLQSYLTDLVTRAQARADALITTSEGFAEVLRERLPARSGLARPVIAVRNGVDVSTVPVSPTVVGGDGPLRVLYLGTLGVSQDLEVAVRSLAELGPTRVSARFIGDGAARLALQQLAEELGAPIAFEDPIGQDRVWEAYDWCHTCLVPLRDWPSFSYTIPSKLFEIMAAGRHITAAVAGEAATIVRDADAGKVVKPGSVSALRSAFAHLEQHREELSRGPGPRQWVEEHANRDRAALAALEVFDRAHDVHRHEDRASAWVRSRRATSMARMVGVSALATRAVSRSRGLVDHGTGRWCSSSGDHGADGAVRPKPPGWPETFEPVPTQANVAAHDPEDLIKGVFLFRGERHELGDPVSWDQPGASHLWRFDLHGFDWAESFATAPIRAWAASSFSRLLESWISGNPVGHGDAWASYPTSLRAWRLCASFGRLVEPGLQPEVADLLGTHRAFIRRNLERDLGGNHLLKNLKALVGLDLFLDGAGASLRSSLDEFTHVLKNQVLHDGGHRERSMSYHVEVLADVVDVIGLLEAGGFDVPAALRQTSTEMRGFLAAVARSDRRSVPTIGDGWPVDARRVAQLIENGEPSRLVIAAESGLVIARPDRSTQLTVNVGPTGWRRLPGHAHADGLAMTFSAGGREILTDLGSSTYLPGPTRTFERSAHSHSTLTVNGRDRAEMWGAFRVGTLDESELVSAEDFGDRFVIEGRADLAVGGGSVHHRRRWTLRPQGLTVEDKVSAAEDGSRHDLRWIEVNFCLGDPAQAITVFGSTVRGPGWELSFGLPGGHAHRIRILPVPTGQPRAVARLAVLAETAPVEVISHLGLSSTAETPQRRHQGDPS